MHLQHDMVYCADLYARPILGIVPDDVTFSAAKLFFAYGLGNNLYFPFRVGASAILYPGRPLPETMLDPSARDKPTIFFGVPTLYAAMLAIRDARNKVRSVLIAPVRLGWRGPAAGAVQTLAGALRHRHSRRHWYHRNPTYLYLESSRGVKPGSSGIVVPGL